jgi:hypothetical protein
MAVRPVQVNIKALDHPAVGVPWTCLADPDGHEFCVLAPS